MEKKPRLKFKIALQACFIFLAVGFLAFVYQVYTLLSKPMVTSVELATTITINRNSSAAAFTRQLEEKKLVQSSNLFLALIRLQGLAHCLKAGIYEIRPGESAQQLLYKVVSGQTMVKSLGIIEGTTLAQVLSNLEKATYLNYNANDLEFLKAKHPNPEGLLLADTYNYNAGSSAKPLLQLANQKLEQFLEQSWQNRSQGLPYKSSYELLIAASILEKEASLAVEKKLISGVVVNRLNKKMPLQMDPTVIYALGSNYQGKLTHDDLSIDSPYNTYRYRGLPPTPIAMVGKEAIEAAAHPQLSNFLYFVAKGDGSHHFSATYDEQRKAISRYQNQYKGQ